MSVNRRPVRIGFSFRIAIILSAFTGGCQVTSAAEGHEVASTKKASLGDGQVNVYLGEVELPADGIWRAVSLSSESQGGNAQVREFYLLPDNLSQFREFRRLGRRLYASLEQRQIASSRWHVDNGYEGFRRYAEEHGGRGPASAKDLVGHEYWGYVAPSWGLAYWPIDELQPLVDPDAIEGRFIYLVPNAPFQFSKTKTFYYTGGDERVAKLVTKQDRVELAFELRPYVDDGKHWVLFTDGSCERVEIDPALVDRHGVSIQPVISQATIQAAAAEPVSTYTVVMTSMDSVKDEFKLVTHNQILDQTIEVDWDVKHSEVIEVTEVRPVLNEARRFAWGPYLRSGQGGVLDIWQASGMPDLPAESQRNLSTFAVLGGRAAIEETLQLQGLNVTRLDEEETVEIESLQGVQVRSHPFDEMLGDAAGGSLELARYVPHDRFFVYVGKPESIPAMLDTGAPFIASLGTSLTGNCLDYNLVGRYLERLGMTRDWLDAVLASGLVGDLAITAPDLFFIDGTDVTVVARLRRPKMLKQLFGMLGVSELSADSVIELPTRSGDKAYMALRGDLLLISTHQGELEQAIRLHEQHGQDSLGESTEFRYMLTQLEVTENTRLYAYLSDPFVRRLVSPGVKIAQRRRVLAKAKMEVLAASQLMARLDGRVSGDSPDEFVEHGYLPQDWRNEGTSIGANGIVRSEQYGPLPRMKTLQETPIKKVTPAEAEAYQDYLENYSRYWRRFFDPIAIRLDEVGTNQLELSTFILPLVDNSIYRDLREWLAHQEDDTPLSVPVLDPSPVILFSANLRDEAWQQMAGDFADFFSRYSGASPAMIDDFGPSVHVAVFDADPIIAMGSGDIFGAFGGNVLRGGGNDMMMLPVFLSMLTRPCSILVETKSPLRTSQYLRQAAQSGTRNVLDDRDFRTSFYQVGEKDEWVWSMEIFGVVKLRYGVEVSGDYVVIRNIPWSSDDRVIRVAPAELNAANLEANPSACIKQLPSLFASAADGQRRSVMSGLARLYPFMLSGSPSIEKAAAEHQRMFGFYPKVSDTDQWTWDNLRLTSKEYGDPIRQRQPAYDPSRPFGLMSRIDTIRLNMQFEQDGLRSSVRWNLR